MKASKTLDIVSNAFLKFLAAQKRQQKILAGAGIEKTGDTKVGGKEKPHLFQQQMRFQ